MARGSTPAQNPFQAPGIKPAIRDAMELMAKAMAGDMVVVVTPADARKQETLATWTQTFYVEIQTAAGEVHTWFNAAIASGVAVSDAGGGTATIPSTTLTFVDGVATVVMSGNAATWASGETATITTSGSTIIILGSTLASKTGVLTFTTHAAPSISPSASPSASPSISPSVSPSVSPS